MAEKEIKSNQVFALRLNIQDHDLQAKRF